ncbi:anaerobic glycerol-3-phosphate dehydrogenase subunit GlpA [Desulfitobacterium sp.]|uniref:anaerobic glycerol-3-phosphate dehydrogenase subunit GlpA n=1 Tax=Desulfitobacterium sp. TaxID=49981 RepID=UPI002B5088F7|nr:anaerobic glycerol-3-phosphate dehydrogenase subunit GlpA [Desulfitobacterium sp.]HVJ47952.1 anaerobic glycerol-3-phosphate dehydrogenase subunit GlpA [Desulfitobacterium sp.]
MLAYSTQVVIVGGGATGVGILRDLSMRGISALLFEQGDLAHGTSSRFHGLLHSGARYVVKDPVAATECIKENLILKKIAANCIADTGGWFVQMKEDDPDFVERWLAGCAASGIPVQEISVEEARSREPLLNSETVRVFEVPDAAVDGFKIIWGNAHSAQRYGGQYKIYHQVTQLLREGDQITGILGIDHVTGEKFKAKGDVVVNAAGAWASQIAGSAGIPLEVICDKGTLLAFNHRLFNRVINRLRTPGDGDIFVPHETITILGTTSEIIDSPQRNQPSDAEVRRLMDLGTQLLPRLAEQRVLRAFSGVRPLHREDQEVPGSEEVGREVSRNFALIDHEVQDGVHGFISIVGGKFTTYRLMAEKVADWVAEKLGNQVPCRTAEESLVPAITEALRARAFQLLPLGATDKMLERLGEWAPLVLDQIEANPAKGQMLCECELVSVAEVEHAVTDADTHSLSDIRRKTRLGMGTCQGAFCSYRALPLLWQEEEKYSSLKDQLIEFLNQRWKGIRPVLWGQQLRETELTRAVYSGILRLGDSKKA